MYSVGYVKIQKDLANLLGGSALYDEAPNCMVLQVREDMASVLGGPACRERPAHPPRCTIMYYTYLHTGQCTSAWNPQQPKHLCPCNRPEGQFCICQGTQISWSILFHHFPFAYCFAILPWIAHWQSVTEPHFYLTLPDQPYHCKASKDSAIIESHLPWLCKSVLIFVALFN